MLYPLKISPIKLQSLYRKYCDNTYFQFTVNIIDSCNYSCPYCYNEKPRTNIKLNLDDLYQYLIFFHQQTNRNIELNILGGEPTLHPNLYSFCEKISKLDYVMAIIFSNLSNNIFYYERLLKIENIRFDFTYHSINNKNNQLYLKKLIQLVSNKYSKEKINITLLIENLQNFDYIKKINHAIKLLNFDKLHNIDYRVVRNYDNIDDISYYNNINNVHKYICQQHDTKTFEIAFSNNEVKQLSIEEMDINTIGKFTGWKCNAGIESQYCHFNGNIYLCQSEFFKGLQPVFSLSNINTWKILTETIICKCSFCCTDNETTKYKE